MTPIVYVDKILLQDQKILRFVVQQRCAAAIKRKLKYLKPAISMHAVACHHVRWFPIMSMHSKRNLICWVRGQDLNFNKHLTLRSMITFKLKTKYKQPNWRFSNWNPIHFAVQHLVALLFHSKTNISLH